MQGFANIPEWSLFYNLTGCEFWKFLSALEVVGESRDMRGQGIRSARVRKRGDQRIPAPRSGSESHAFFSSPRSPMRLSSSACVEASRISATKNSQPANTKRSIPSWQPRPSLRAGPGVMPRHTEGRPAHRAVATGCRSLGSAWPTYPAVGAELPVRFDLAAAITALLHELVKCLMELQEGGLPPALLGWWLLLRVVHGISSVSHCLPALISLISMRCASAPRP
jgi:hypothetical protein